MNEKISFLIGKSKSLNKIKNRINNLELYRNTIPICRPLESKNSSIRALSEKLNMNSRELELLLMEVFSTNNDVLFEQIKEILFIAKLSCGSAIEQYNKESKLNDEYNRSQQHQYEQRIAEIAHLQEQKESLENSLNEINDVFSKLLEDVKRIVERCNYSYADLTVDEKKIIDVFKNGSKRFNIRKDIDLNKDVIIVNWNYINNLKSSHKLQIFMSYIKLNLNQEFLS